MKIFKRHILMAGFLLSAVNLVAQDDNEQTHTVQGSNIQNLTPSKLIGKGQWDIKWFNNYYTQNESTFASEDGIRQNFFTSTLDVFAGVSQNKRVNIGAILEYRNNNRDFVTGQATENRSRSGITSIAPAIKFVPFGNVGNFSVLSAFHIPLVDQETDNGVFLDQKSFIWQNRFFYDHTFAGNKWQLFSEINSELSFGDEADSFANNSLRLTPGLFLSYFPSSKFTVLGLVQHTQLLDLGNDFTQNFTAVGGGVKYQLTDELNVEGLYTNFVRGSDTGLGQTFNIGLRAVF